MESPLVNLFGVSVVAFAVPFALGFFPRLRVPAAVVEIIAGILVGPSVLHWLEIDNAVELMSTLGVAFLLFLAGLELDLATIRGRPLKLGAIGFALSLGIALACAAPLGYLDVILTPLLVAVALCSTSVGIVVPVLRDTNNLKTKVGTYTVAGGAAAEFGSIVLLGGLFSGTIQSITRGVSPLLLEPVVIAVFAAVIALVFWLITRANRWETGLRVADRLDETSSQLRTRFAVVLILGTAVVAALFGFEAILGTFMAGIFMGALIKGDPKEGLYRTKLEAMGFGFFVPVFFISSGMKLDIENLFTFEELWKIALFLGLLLLARGLPAILYRRYLGARGTVATGLMQATNLSFVVVAVTLGLELNMIRPITGSALVMAGLLSAILFPALAQSILARDTA